MRISTAAMRGKETPLFLRALGFYGFASWELVHDDCPSLMMVLAGAKNLRG